VLPPARLSVLIVSHQLIKHITNKSKMKYFATLALFLGAAVVSALPEPEVAAGVALDERGDSGCYPLLVSSSSLPSMLLDTDTLGTARTQTAASTTPSASALMVRFLVFLRTEPLP
jgi:hypothetical protein